MAQHVEEEKADRQADAQTKPTPADVTSASADQDNPWPRVMGAFKDNPQFDAMMEEVYANRHRQAAEVEAEIKAENEAATRGVTTMTQKATIPVAERPDAEGNGLASPKETAADAPRLGQDHPLASTLGIFENDPMWDAMMQNIYKRRRQIDAEFAAADDVASEE